MARPRTIADIELEAVQFATVSVDNIAADGSLLKAYGTFMEAVQKAGATVEVRYSTATFTRPPEASEQAAQLQHKQSAWDEGKKQYEIYAAVGECEYSIQETIAQRWAEAEGLPYPPEHDVIDAIDAVIRDEVNV